jgi:hypothetical protein
MSVQSGNPRYYYLDRKITGSEREGNLRALVELVDEGRILQLIDYHSSHLLLAQFSEPHPASVLAVCGGRLLPLSSALRLEYSSGH